MDCGPRARQYGLIALFFRSHHARVLGGTTLAALPKPWPPLPNKSIGVMPQVRAMRSAIAARDGLVRYNINSWLEIG